MKVVLGFDLMFNATFSNISWQPVLVVEEAGVPRENIRICLVVKPLSLLVKETRILVHDEYH